MKNETVECQKKRTFSRKCVRGTSTPQFLACLLPWGFLLLWSVLLMATKVSPLESRLISKIERSAISSSLSHLRRQQQRSKYQWSYNANSQLLLVKQSSDTTSRVAGRTPIATPNNIHRRYQPMPSSFNAWTRWRLRSLDYTNFSRNTVRDIEINRKSSPTAPNSSEVVVSFDRKL